MRDREEKPEGRCKESAIENVKRNPTNRTRINGGVEGP